MYGWKLKYQIGNGCSHCYVSYHQHGTTPACSRKQPWEKEGAWLVKTKV